MKQLLRGYQPPCAPATPSHLAHPQPGPPLGMTPSLGVKGHTGVRWGGSLYPTPFSTSPQWRSSTSPVGTARVASPMPCGESVGNTRLARRLENGCLLGTGDFTSSLVTARRCLPPATHLARAGPAMARRSGGSQAWRADARRQPLPLLASPWPVSG